MRSTVHVDSDCRSLRQHQRALINNLLLIKYFVISITLTWRNFFILTEVNNYLIVRVIKINSENWKKIILVRIYLNFWKRIIIWASDSEVQIPSQHLSSANDRVFPGQETRVENLLFRLSSGYKGNFYSGRKPRLTETVAETTLSIALRGSFFLRNLSFFWSFWTTNS